MDADFSIELGREDPVLDFPWKDPSGKLAYVDVKRHPELIAQIEEAEKFSELKDFLRLLNSPRSLIETAKCDAWGTQELGPGEDIYDASHKFASYVDIVFSKIENGRSSSDVSSLRKSFSAHEQFARKLVELLSRSPDTSSSAEVCVRRCYFEDDSAIQEGFYCTLYVSGYGPDEHSARQNWAVALKMTANAVMQLSANWV